jgi:CheY-like chemotaxis protein
MEASKKRRILFVDDEELLLKGLQRMLRSMRHEWEMRFVDNGQAALDLIQKETFDAVITDMQMPGMSGIQLLETVMQEYPDIVRIILSGQLDQEMILKTVRSAHQHLSKPCDADLLKATLAQAFGLRDLLADENIQKLVSRIESLPSLPSLYLEIMEELQSANTSFKKIGVIIAKDVGMTAKILQMVNSAFFGLRRQISNPQDAVSYLGFETIKSLVLSAKIFSQFDQKKLPGFSLDNLWNHSMLTGPRWKGRPRKSSMMPIWWGSCMIWANWFWPRIFRIPIKRSAMKPSLRSDRSGKSNTRCWAPPTPKSLPI